MMMLLVLLGKIPAVRAQPHDAQEAAVVIDGKSGGRTFDGVGAISAGGSSRLLRDYPEPERSRILDYLFKPDYGASLQILKVEIGGDMNSTDGAEASHMRTPDDHDCDRGYEWWLIKEAKKRNPDLQLIGLAWGAPGWVGKFWSDKTIDYLISWLDCAKANGITIDYIGGWNERGWNADWYIKLNKALEKKYPKVKIIAADDIAHPWSVATEMAHNPALKAAVDIVGDHSECGWRTDYKRCPSTKDARGLGKPLWNSEYSSMGHNAGAKALARGMNRLYIEGRVTGILVWSLVSAWYGNLPIANTGLLLAEWPWSGYYEVGKSIWVFAHTAQFVKPGWTYMDSSCGFLPSGASYVSLKSPDGHDYSTIIETMDMPQPQMVRFKVEGGLSTSAVHLWETDLTATGSGDQFAHVKDISPVNGSFNLVIKPGRLYTFSTTTGQHKGTAASGAHAAAQMPLPYREDFQSYGPGKLAKYFSDINGAFETEPCQGGRKGTCYGQVLSDQPVVWGRPGKMPPTTIMGDPSWWGDYKVSTDVLLEQPGYVELLGRIAAQMDTIMAGYHLRINSDGAWKLYRCARQKKGVVLKAGKVPFGTGKWHRIALQMRDCTIAALIDGKQVASVQDTFNLSGQIGLTTSKWEHAQFDNLTVTPTGAWPRFIPHQGMRATATSEHTGFHRGYSYLAGNAIDDRPESAWNSEWEPKAKLPQSITLDLGRSYQIRGLTYRPDFISFGKGRITGYRIYVSSDGQSYHEVTKGKWADDVATKMAVWPVREARYIRLEAVEGADSLASAAEINVMLDYSALPTE
jgi:O-glycosyl hydrolase